LGSNTLPASFGNKKRTVIAHGPFSSLSKSGALLRHHEFRGDGSVD
jgi:hypothetical protein